MFKKSFIVFTLCSLFFSSYADEGMYPLSEIGKVNMKKAGLKIDQKEVYNPNGISLIDALVNVGGCTGSFVSGEGLIITNHHCAFGAVQLASTPQKDYLTNGFVAKTRGEEIEARGLTCRITDSYEDVSQKILNSVKDIADPAQRLTAIQTKIAEIVKEEETKDKTIKAEVSEMFIGRTYVLFRYKTIQDVRLVYVPQRAIGEFGGESDNWVWPRHTGDFSFLRAYVAPDGSSATYSKNNVPYQPKKFLKVNPEGVNENDFVFILGYPGRTYRNYPSQYIEYQEKFQLPYISSLYEWQNAQMEETSTSKEFELKQATRIKRNANVLKNYKGKIKGLTNLQLVEQRRNEEKELQKFIENDAQLKTKYGSLLTNINMVYAEIFSDAKKGLILQQIFPSSNALSSANQINLLKKKINEAKEEDREKVFNDSKAGTLKAIKKTNETFVPETDKRLLARILTDAYNENILVNKDGIAASVTVVKLYKDSRFVNENYSEEILNLPLNDFLSVKDDMLTLAAEVSKQNDAFNEIKKQRDGKLNKLLADYVDVKILFKKTNFIPDANSTLRLTYGYVRGYSPVDATYYSPTTTITGLVQKGTNSGDYYLPPVIRELYKQKNFGRFVNKKGEVPVAFLYNMDTTGGNSGSPIMNEKGELVGVNFDRAYEATINDFAWNESYSRSIGVDIRYVLWVAQKVDHADFILKELGVSEK
jgi:hypothetical protein